MNSVYPSPVDSGLHSFCNRPEHYDQRFLDKIHLEARKTWIRQEKLLWLGQPMVLHLRIYEPVLILNILSLRLADDRWEATEARRQKVKSHYQLIPLCIRHSVLSLWSHELHVECHYQPAYILLRILRESSSQQLHWNHILSSKHSHSFPCVSIQILHCQRIPVYLILWILQ